MIDNESKSISDENFQNIFEEAKKELSNNLENNEESAILEELKPVNNFEYIKKIISSNKNVNIIEILQLFEDYKHTNELFKLLIENENLWENEPITNLIFNLKESIDDKIIEKIKYLLLFEYLLLKILSFNNKYIEISHYTSLDTLFILLDKKNIKDENKEIGNIRMYNITTANDPKEGKIIENILNKNNIDIKIIGDENAVTFQTSYSRNKDSLNMFRLYGKKDNKEATGISLVLDNNYFSFDYIYPYSYNKEKYNDETKNNDLFENYQNKKRNLYWMLYYNEKENLLVFNPNKSKYSADITIHLNNLSEKSIKIEDIDNLEIYDEKYKIIIRYIFENIYYYTKLIKSDIDNKKMNNTKINDEIKNKIYSYLFENIKYIIKHDAFFEEQELRMLLTTDHNNEDICSDENAHKLYVDYLPLFSKNTNYIKEIIIGSKVENKESLAEYIRHILNKQNNERLKKIKITISEAPLK